MSIIDSYILRISFNLSIEPPKVSGYFYICSLGVLLFAVIFVTAKMESG